MTDVWNYNPYANDPQPVQEPFPPMQPRNDDGSALELSGGEVLVGLMVLAAFMAFIVLIVALCVRSWR